MYAKVRTATRKFIKVSTSLAEENPLSRAYRISYRKPLLFYYEHSIEEAIALLKKEAGE